MRELIAELMWVVILVLGAIGLVGVAFFDVGK